MFKTFDQENDVVTDITYSSTDYSVTSSSTSSFDVTYYRASINSSTGVYNNIKNYLYSSPGTSALKSFYSSATTNSVAIIAIGSTMLNDGLSGSSSSGVGDISFTLKDGSNTVTIIDFQDSTSLQTRTNVEYYGKLIDASTSATTQLVYGEVFYNLGLIVLHGFQSNNSLSSNLQNVTSTVGYDATPAGSNIGISNFGFTTVTKQARQIYYARLNNKEFNYSNNPTFKDTYGLINDSLTADPFTYVTTVGLYNDNNQLLAIAKMSQPQRKDFYEELLIKCVLKY